MRSLSDPVYIPSQSEEKAEKERPIVLKPGLVRSPSDPFYIPSQSEESYYRQVVLSKKKTERNKIIRKILTENGIFHHKSIRDTFVDSIYDGTSDVDPDVAEIIIKELKRKNLNV